MNDSQDRDPRYHIEMWKHYDNLRQAKNTGFLTTNSILIAIVGFLIREPKYLIFVRSVSALGALVCVSWFLLLTRNAAYIKHHRQGTPIGHWKPSPWLPPSKWTERTPSFAFTLFWIGVLVFGPYITH
jgi:hypothetical protein